MKSELNKSVLDLKSWRVYAGWGQTTGGFNTYPIIAHHLKSYYAFNILNSPLDDIVNLPGGQLYKLDNCGLMGGNILQDVRDIC